MWLLLIRTNLKGNVQRKLRWVESGVIRRVWASYHGARNYFSVLGGLHLVFTFSPIPVSTVQIIGKSWKNRRSGARNVAPIGWRYRAATADVFGAA